MKRRYVPWKDDEKDFFWYNVQQFEAENRKIQFDIISRSIRTKTARYCYDFYILNKDKQEARIKRHQWTHDEEELVYTYIYQNGADWNGLMKLMPSFSYYQLKNRYYVISKRKETYQRERNKQKIIREVSKIIGKY